jgi:hypothetical protein
VINDVATTILVSREVEEKQKIQDEKKIFEEYWIEQCLGMWNIKNPSMVC